MGRRQRCQTMPANGGTFGGRLGQSNRKLRIFNELNYQGGIIDLLDLFRDMFPYAPCGAKWSALRHDPADIRNLP